MIMKVKVYVNWEEQEILSESEFSEMIANKTKEKIDDDYELNHFLEYQSTYSYSEVFRLTAKEKDKIYKEFQEYCREEAEADVLNEDNWFEKFIEI